MRTNVTSQAFRQVTAEGISVGRAAIGRRTTRHVCQLLVRATWQWMLLDLLIGLASVYLGFAASPSVHNAAPTRFVVSPNFVASVLGVTTVLSCLITGLYERSAFASLFQLTRRTGMAVISTWVWFTILEYLVAFETVGRWVAVLSAFTLFLGITLPRAGVVLMSRRTKLRLLALSETPGAARMLEAVVAQELDDKTVVAGEYQLPHAVGPGSTTHQTLRDVCNQLDIDTIVVVGASGRCPSHELMECISAGIQAVDLATYVESTYSKVVAEVVGLDWLVQSNGAQMRPAAAPFKRASDILLAFTGLVLTLPMLPLIWLAVRLSSPGPVVYRQVRVGRGGKPFTIYKFRSMAADAERDGKAQWAQQLDPRVTAIGRFLRRTHIDELPQMWNVLKGDMSFVGPRPERPEFISTLEATIPHYGFRHLVKPGITGWAQVMYRYGASVDDTQEKLSYDLYYVKYGTIAFDVRIILRTLGALLKGSR